MKFSEGWLRELVNPNISTQALVDQLTMAGLEVDGFEPVAFEFTDDYCTQMSRLAEARPRETRSRRERSGPEV